MSDLGQLARDYKKVEAAILFLEKNSRRQPMLEEIAAAAGLSEFHFQRLFSRWVGISPKRFLQFLTKEHAKKLIEGSQSLLGVALDAGLSGPGRLHDLFVTCEAVTPGQYRRRGEGVAIAYGIHASPFGDCLLGVSGRGVCWLSFLQGDSRDHLAEFGNYWKNASITHAPERTGLFVDRIFDFPKTGRPEPFHLYVRGTNFQIKVWEALLRIPLGRAVTYQDIAAHIGQPKAARAVGNAVGDNPLSFVIPCHRVIRKLGEFGHYGGGPARKKAILGWEAAACDRLSGTG
jgi:AraC family transcriptional regulator of adaptative response/methylated-DNA-[protein]-cysteine methyltransferase